MADPRRPFRGFDQGVDVGIGVERVQPTTDELDKRAGTELATTLDSDGNRAATFEQRQVRDGHAVQIDPRCQ